MLRSRTQFAVKTAGGAIKSELQGGKPAVNGKR